MNEMIDRVARAIEGALPNQMKHLGPLLARAAIEALADPTDAMIEAAGVAAYGPAFSDPTVPNTGPGSFREAARAGIVAAINAALKEET